MTQRPLLHTHPIRTALIAATAIAVGLTATAELSAQSRFAPAVRGTAPTMLDLHNASQPAVGDVDGDGDLDIVLATDEDQLNDIPVHHHRLLRNDGGGHFTDVSATQMPTMSVCLAHDVALADVDLDGDLDILIAHAAISDDLQDALLLDPTPLQNRLLLNDGHGNFTEAKNRISPAEYVTEAFAVGDFDGDGDPDLITGNYPYGNRGASYSGQNRYFENDGTGTFTERTGHLSADNRLDRSSAVGDLDGDGDLDVLFSYGSLGTLSGHGIVLYRNDGSGRFATVSVPWQQQREAQRMTLLDAEGDGDLDIAVMVVDRNTQTVALLKNDGNAFFQDATMAAFGDPSRPLLLTGSPASSGDVQAIDIDGDGDDDLAVASNPVSRLFRNDAGVFVELPASALPASWVHDAQIGTCFSGPESGSIAMAAGDLDGNGLDDLVGVHPFDARIHLSTGLGTFEPLGEPRWNDDHRGDPAVGDIDGDGVPDVIAPAVGSNWVERPPLRVLLGDGYGGFRDVSATHAPVFGRLDHVWAGFYGATPTLADVDGDGDLDLLASTSRLVNNTSTVNELRLWRNDGAGHFTGATSTLPASVASSIVSDIECADLDGDGDLDCVIVKRGNLASHVFVCTNDGTGTFTDTSAGLPAVSELFRQVSIGDVDGDGRPDLVLAATPKSTSSGYQGGQTRIWRNAGGMTFVEQTNLPFDSDHTWSAALADLDSDGDLDVVLANGGDFEPCGSLLPGAAPQQNRIWQNDGSGGFTDVTATLLPQIFDRTWQVVVFDADGDGAPDLFARNGCPYLFNDDRLDPEPACPPPADYLLVQRNGRFVDVSATDLPGPPAYTMAGVAFDFDTDGDQDLMIESAAPVDRLHILANRTSQLAVRERLRLGLTGRLVGTRLAVPPSPAGSTLVVALAAKGGDLPAPGLGNHFRLEPSSTIVFGVASLGPTGGQGTVKLNVPPLPALLGQTLYFQGIWLESTRALLTNAVREQVGL